MCVNLVDIGSQHLRFSTPSKTSDRSTTWSVSTLRWWLHWSLEWFFSYFSRSKVLIGGKLVLRGPVVWIPIGSPKMKGECYLRGPPTRIPNHQFTMSWKLIISQFLCEVSREKSLNNYTRWIGGFHGVACFGWDSIGCLSFFLARGTSR